MLADVTLACHLLTALGALEPLGELARADVARPHDRAEEHARFVKMPVVQVPDRLTDYVLMRRHIHQLYV